MNIDSSTVAHIWQVVATTSIGITVTLVSFWAAVVRNMVNKAEVIALIETNSPYIQDRQFIMERLNNNKESQAAFANALQKNTEVMNELKVQIAMLAKTLEALEDRIEQK
jgi:uncharacterized membrane protein YkgB